MPHPQVLRDMALFVEVAKRKSFSQAATALGMPISSLSRRITLFEAAVGLRLLDRTTRKLVLTSYGEAYLAQATRLVEEAQRTFDDMVAQAKGPTGFLKIAAPPDFWVLRHLSEVISEFSHIHEHIHVHVDLRPAPVDLAADSYDLAIAIEEPRETSLIVRRVADVQNGLFAAPSYLDGSVRPQHPRDLAGHQVIVPALGREAAWTMTRDNEVETVKVGGPILQQLEPRPALRRGRAGDRGGQRDQRRSRRVQRAARTDPAGMAVADDADLYRDDLAAPAGEVAQLHRFHDQAASISSNGRGERIVGRDPAQR